MQLSISQRVEILRSIKDKVMANVMPDDIEILAVDSCLVWSGSCLAYLRKRKPHENLDNSISICEAVKGVCEAINGVLSGNVLITTLETASGLLFYQVDKSVKLRSDYMKTKAPSIGSMVYAYDYEENYNESRVLCKLLEVMPDQCKVELRNGAIVYYRFFDYA